MGSELWEVEVEAKAPAQAQAQTWGRSTGVLVEKMGCIVPVEVDFRMVLGYTYAAAAVTRVRKRVVSYTADTDITLLR